MFRRQWIHKSANAQELTNCDNSNMLGTIHKLRLQRGGGRGSAKSKLLLTRGEGGLINCKRLQKNNIFGAQLKISPQKIKKIVAL